MAHNAFRLRRALSISSTLLSHTRLTPTTTTTTLNSLSSFLHSFSPQTPTTCLTHTHSSCFHSTTHLSLSSSSRSSFNDIEKIDPDTILFEGCDYKHWLIVMDFGKDPAQRPPPEQMVETYVQTCAQVLGSVEEAKKKIYACSTTTYTGFQVEVDEETSQKFENLPGVIFVLPDSYIDPVNKEYGGDKYVNGTIIPRPPPVQYGRVRRGGRQNDQRPRGPMPNQQRNPAYNQHGSMPGDVRGHMPQQNYPPQQNNPPQQNYPPQQHPPQQNYCPPAQGDGGNPMPTGTHYPGGGRDGYQGGRNNYVPPHQGNFDDGFNRSQGHMSTSTANYGGFAPQGPLSNRPGDHGYNLSQGGGHGGYVPSGQMGFSGNNGNHTPPPPATGAYQQTGVGSFEQSRAGQYGHGPSGSYGQAGYGPGYTPHRENQRFSHTSDEQNNTSESRNYSPAPQTELNHDVHYPPHISTRQREG